MAKALDSGALTTPGARTHWLYMVRTLRLVSGYIILFGSALFFLSTSWDIQWHTYIGRDRTLIPPHILMLLSITLCGLAALSTVLVETFWAHRHAQIASNSTPFADAFHAPLGAYIAGYGALASAIGFPLDSYWHSLYGIDVQIWAPFHVMIIASMVTVALGAVYMLVSTAHLAARDSAPLACRLSHAGILVALAVMLSILTFLLFDAYGDMGTFALGAVSLNVFAALAALFGLYTFTIAAHTLPWRWAATSVVTVSLVFITIIWFYVPPATALLLKLEQLSYRRGGSHLPVVPVDWPILFIIAAVIFDLVRYQAGKRHWSGRTLLAVLAVSTLVGFLPMPLIFPIYPALVAARVGIAGSIITLLLGFAGGYVGGWLGNRSSEVLETLEQ
jgi:hypothetical protein